MSLLSKSEIQFLQGQKQVSKSYEYKLKSIIKRKLTTLLDREIPLLSSLFPNLDLTKISKTPNNHHTTPLTQFSKIINNQNITTILSKDNEIYNNLKDKFNNHSPAQIRTGVKGSKGLYAWPLHSALVILPGFRAFLYCKYGRY